MKVWGELTVPETSSLLSLLGISALFVKAWPLISFRCGGDASKSCKAVTPLFFWSSINYALGNYLILLSTRQIRPFLDKPEHVVRNIHTFNLYLFIPSEG